MMASQPTAHVENAQRAILVKLVTFSVLLAVVPISLYFLSLTYLWKGNGIYAALTAVFAANLVLAGYIVSSIADDRQEAKTAAAGKLPIPESKKDQ